MKIERSVLGLAIICAVVILLSLGGLVWVFASGLAFDLDGLLLILVCLTMGGIFLIMLLLMAKQAGWLGRLRFPRKTAAGGEGK